MNPKIKKTKDELERTKFKIAELQALVPQLERNITDMENSEIIRLVRSANIAPADLPAFIASIKSIGMAVPGPAPNPAETNEPERDNAGAGGDYSGEAVNQEEENADA